MDPILYQAIKDINPALLSYFGWAGGFFPYVPKSASDIVISANTTWNDNNGFKQVRKLTINAGITLKITKSPFIIFCEELVGGVGSVIDASGESGSASRTYSSPFTVGQAWGTIATHSSGGWQAVGGCGGGILFILTNKISGSAITIKANGGNGYQNGVTPSNNADRLIYGQGAFGANTGQNNSGNAYDGRLYYFGNAYTYSPLHPMGFLLAGGADAGTYVGNLRGMGGKFGAGCSDGAGASGIGGGSSCSVANLGASAQSSLMLPHIIEMALRYGCKGGGGGGAGVYYDYGSVTKILGAGGGGGGSVCVFVKEYTATPVMQANGGTGVHNDLKTATITNANNGGAGKTFLVLV